MKSIIKSVILLSLLALTMISGAQTNDKKMYAEAVYTYGRYDEPGAWFTNGLVSGRLGYKINNNIAAELQGGMSTGNTSFYYGSTLINAKIDNIIGAYAKFIAPVSENLSLFAKAGMTSGKVSASSAYGRAWASDSGISYGLGLEVDINKSTYVGLDYMSYYNKDSVSIVGTSLSLGFRF